MLFDTQDIHGNKIEVKTPTKDSMIAALENPQITTARKELSKKALAWYGAELNKPPLTGNSELDKAAQLMLVEYHATSLWDGTYRFEERPVKTSAEGDEAKRTVIVDAKSGEVLAL
jgi:hypothetical protein